VIRRQHEGRKRGHHAVAAAPGSSGPPGNFPLDVTTMGKQGRIDSVLLGRRRQIPEKAVEKLIINGLEGGYV